MTRDILAAVAVYFIGAVATALVGTLIGSFVFLEWWTPLSLEGGRMVVAWIAVGPALAVFLNRRFS